jgi:hypothetical protein
MLTAIDLEVVSYEPSHVHVLPFHATERPSCKTQVPLCETTGSLHKTDAAFRETKTPLRETDGGQSGNFAKTSILLKTAASHADHDLITPIDTTAKAQPALRDAG